MFRRERPQKGRYRQFYQIGAEVIGPATAGSDSPARDAEILELLATLLDRLGIENWTLELNSIGCADDRAKYNDALRKALEPVAAKMCADCQRRAVTNPLRVFDCKVAEDQPIIEKLPRISQYLDEPCRKHFEAGAGDSESRRGSVHAQRPSGAWSRLLHSHCVRVYPRSVRSTECDSGRRTLRWAFGIAGRAERSGHWICHWRRPVGAGANESAEAVQIKPDVYIAPLGAGMDREAARLARELRRHDVVAELGDETFRLKKSFEIASKLGARFILIVGENEVKAGAFALKNLESGEQVSVPRGELAQKIQAGR